MEPFVNFDSFWDLPQNGSAFSTLPEDDFLALLQKQFPTTGSLDLSPPDGVDPLNINPLSIPNPTPPSTDSSPSPPSVAQEPTVSRRQSGVFSTNSQSAADSGADDPTLKRKASDDSMQDEPTYKNAHTLSDSANRKPSSGPHRRKSGNPQQDESRLMKRKEQNRAAQRAFRERKEKHVKDLEDQVAALEAKNQLAVSENGNLRDLLTRLQSENMALKQAAFTFSVPKAGGSPVTTVFPPQQTFFSPGPSPGSGSSMNSPVSRTLSQQPQSYDVNFASLIPFDPASFDEPSGEGPMNLDYAFGQANGSGPYKTIASNPMFMSFAEPTPYDLSPPPMHPILQSPASPADSQHTPLSGLPTFSWNSPLTTATNSPPSSLDQLFGGFHGPQSPVDFTALLQSPPSSVSPVSHAAIRSNTASSSAGSPGVASSNGSNGSSPAPSSTVHTILPGGTDGCPRTKAEVSKMIQQQGASAFVQQEEQSSMHPQSSGLYQNSDTTGDSCQRLTPDTLMASTQNQSSADETTVGPNGGFVRKMTDGTGSIVMCKGSSFPKTEKSDRNIEVLTAWRTITSNPQFKNVDINELCSEFTKKARCDGTKVVLEPEGVHAIIETLQRQ